MTNTKKTNTNGKKQTAKNNETLKLNAIIKKATRKVIANSTNKSQPNTTFDDIIITLDNIQDIAQIIACRAIKTIIGVSGDKYAFELFHSVCSAIRTAGTDCGFGSDLISVAKLTLSKYINKNLGFITDELNAKKEKMSVRRLAYKAVCNYIDGERRKATKIVCIDDIDENGERVFIHTNGWNVDNARSYKILIILLAKLNLTAQQKKFLKLKMAGWSHSEVAKTMGITENAAKLIQLRIRKKAENPEFLELYKKYKKLNENE